MLPAPNFKMFRVVLLQSFLRACGLRLPKRRSLLRIGEASLKAVLPIRSIEGWLAQVSAGKLVAANHHRAVVYVHA
jgi:hypothetical protein